MCWPAPFDLWSVGPYGLFLHHFLGLVISCHIGR